MANNFQTTFIPKASGQEISSVISTPTKQGYGLSKVLAMVTLLIFILTSVFGGFLWFKKIKLDSDILELEESLRVVKESLEDGKLDEVTDLNNRLLAATTLYSGHLSPVQIFPILEEFTLKQASLNSFLYEYVEDGRIHIFANGSAKDYKAIVRLSDAYEESENMSEIIVTNLKETTGGIVTFSLEAFIEPEVVKYKNLDFSKPQIINAFETETDIVEFDINNDNE